MRSAIPQLRGLGPTTRSALGLAVKENELSQVGISNGALMRTALVGLAFRPDEAKERRAFVTALAAATHKSPIAIGCALIGSALFADARAYGEANSPFEVALGELAELDMSISINDWIEPICTGVSNESTETLNALLWTVKSSDSAREALQIACELGGDTDTVAALSTSLLIARKRALADFETIPWLDEIAWDEIPTLENSAERLHKLYSEEKVCP
jgi:ADP-ribosylglycohydrolase